MARLETISIARKRLTPKNFASFTLTKQVNVWQNHAITCLDTVRTMPEVTGNKMKLLFCFAFTICLTSRLSFAGLVYLNTFDDESSLNDFVVIEGPSSIPLHSVSIDAGQLRIDTDFTQSGTATATGRASLMSHITNLHSTCDTVLSENPGPVTWGINLRNADGAFNNGYAVVLACTSLDPFETHAARGYTFRGGGSVGDIMSLRRVDSGLGGGQERLIAITNGLAPGQYGSFRITYDPENDEWSLYGEMGASYVDPLAVTQLLGTVVESTYTTSNAPYIGLVGKGTGVNWFDNFSLSINSTTAPPEPVPVMAVRGLLIQTLAIIVVAIVALKLRGRGYSEAG